MSKAARQALSNIKGFCKKHSAEKFKARKASKSAPKAESPKEILKEALHESGESESHESEESESYEDELPAMTISVGMGSKPKGPAKMPVGKKK